MAAATPAESFSTMNGCIVRIPAILLVDQVSAFVRDRRTRNTLTTVNKEVYQSIIVQTAIVFFIDLGLRNDCALLPVGPERSPLDRILWHVAQIKAIMSKSGWFGMEPPKFIALRGHNNN
jgi:hypothetical protein